MYSILILSFSFDFKSVSKIKGSGKVPAARKENTKTRKHEKETFTTKVVIYVQLGKLMLGYIALNLSGNFWLHKTQRGLGPLVKKLLYD